MILIQFIKALRPLHKNMKDKIKILMFVRVFLYDVVILSKTMN